MDTTGVASVYAGVSLVAALPTILYVCHRLGHLVELRRNELEKTTRFGIMLRVDNDLENAARRRLRVSGSIVQLAWALAVFGATPKVLTLILGWHEVDRLVGSPNGWLVALSIAGFLFLVAIFPTDKLAVRVACILLLAVLLTTGGYCVVLAVTSAETFALVLQATVAALCFAAGLALAPTLRFHGPRAMLPRPALRRLWLVLRLSCLVVGTTYVGFMAVKGRLLEDIGGLSACVVLVAGSGLMTRANRGRITRVLGKLGGRGGEQEEAAAIAALVGGAQPGLVLARAAKVFRALPASQLHAADLADNRQSEEVQGLTLHERTIEAELGDVTVFLSHSWVSGCRVEPTTRLLTEPLNLLLQSDEEEAPGAKYSAISRWAGKHRQDNNHEDPTLWLVRSCTPFPQIPATNQQHTMVWRRAQDKACIDQNDIEQSLACLPVFLASCKQLLCIAGPTYVTRLWCAR